MENTNKTGFYNGKSDTWVDMPKKFKRRKRYKHNKKGPDTKKHQKISFIKSGIRILGYGLLWWSIDIAVVILILSEIVGIKEEMV